MANNEGKVTTGYAVEPRKQRDGSWIYAVIRETLYRGKPGKQLVTIYTEQAVAESIRGTLDMNKGRELR